MLSPETVKELSKFGATGIIAFIAFWLIQVGDKHLDRNRTELIAYVMSQQNIIEHCMGVDTDLPTFKTTMEKIHE